MFSLYGFREGKTRTIFSEPGTRAPGPKELDFEPLHWRSLKIEAFMPLSEITARVKFVAKARDDAGNMITLKENSRFVKKTAVGTTLTESFHDR
mgnify:CR=1 FL=1